MIVMAPEHRPSDTQALLSEMRQWVDRLCRVADDIDARARETAREGESGPGAGTDRDRGGGGAARRG